MEVLAERRSHCTRVPDDAHEDRVRKYTRHLFDVRSVEGSLLAPALFALFQCVPTEHAGVELAQAFIDLPLRPVQPLVPTLPELPVRDLLDPPEAAHEAGLWTDGDMRVAIEDQSQHGRTRSHRANDEDGALVCPAEVVSCARSAVHVRHEDAFRALRTACCASRYAPPVLTRRYGRADLRRRCVRPLPR